MPWTGSCGNWAASSASRLPRTGSYRTLDLPPFLAGLIQWAMDNRRSACSCPVLDGRADCKVDDETEPNYLFLGPKGGHPRRSNYADRYLTPAAEGFYPARDGTPPSGLCHRRALAGNPDPQRQLEDQGRRRGRRHVAGPHRQVPAAR